jgi:hypothetical protein
LPSARGIVESDTTNASQIASEALRFAIFIERLLTVQRVRNAEERRRASLFTFFSMTIFISRQRFFHRFFHHFGCGDGSTS